MMVKKYERKQVQRCKKEKRLKKLRNGGKMNRQVYNPYMPTFEYVPDGEPHLFDGRIYVYGSHDRFDGAEFCLNDYVCYSADVNDLTNWRYEGIIYRKEQDPRNHNIPAGTPASKPKFGVVPKNENSLNPPGIHAMWAPDVVKGKDGRYYLYYCLDYLPEIGVAVCGSPAGKYEFLGFVRHKDGALLGRKEGDLIQFDPGIFIDDDGTIYLYSGNAPMHKEQFDEKKGSQVMTLNEDMLTLATEPKPLMADLHEAEGTEYDGHAFFEASSIRKINGKYYFVYSSVRSHELCYAVSDKPDEGYRYGGTLVDIGDAFLEGRTEEEALNCLGNTHGGIECAKGQWYVFYHRQTNRTNFSRQACAEKIYFDEKGRITQAEVTSCGLNEGPLRGRGTYPAAIACQLNRYGKQVHSNPLVMKEDYPYLTQDMEDREPTPELVEKDREHPVQYIKNIKDGTVAGYKYFAFEGMSRVSMEIRGKAEGSVKVCIDTPENCVGKIPVHIDAQDWVSVQGDIEPVEGIHALYFQFEGECGLDFVTFMME